MKVYPILAACSLWSTLFCSFNPEVLQTLLHRYEESDSDSLVIYQNNELKVELGKQQPMEVMSITKSIVGLCIGILIDEGKIDSLYTPVSFYFPEWEETNKSQITLRHIMNHTSGLASFKSFEEALFIPDFLQCALDADLEQPTGSHFFYNNRAVNILGGVVEKVSGMTVDQFAKEKIFAPLEISNYSWNQDAMGRGICACGLELTSKDLAKIGMLILEKGIWNGKRIISEEFLEHIFTQSQHFNETCGLLWWLDREESVHWPEGLLMEYEMSGIDPHYIQPLHKLKGASIPLTHATLHTLFGSEVNYYRFADQAQEKGLPLYLKQIGEVTGYRADGYLGQYLLILPEHKLVAVRQAAYGKKPDDQYDGFEDFGLLIHQLIQQ